MNERERQVRSEGRGRARRASVLPVLGERLGRRGSVLVHVLVMGVIMGFIVASMLGLMLLQYGQTVRAQKGSIAKRDAEGALARLITNWNMSGLVCDDNDPGYTCTGTPGTCACTCTGGNLPSVVVNADPGDSSYCLIEISSDIQ